MKSTVHEKYHMKAYKSIVYEKYKIVDKSTRQYKTGYMKVNNISKLQEIGKVYVIETYDSL